MSVDFSVIVPVFNSENYLKLCLDSVLCQTCNNIEVICVNDGSTDNSKFILDEYSKKDSRVYVINKKNGGPSSARNEGIKIAKGEYIYFLDDDDFLSQPNILSDCLKIMKEESLDVIVGGAETFYDKPELESFFYKFKSRYHIKNKYESIYSGFEAIEKLRKNNDWFPTVGTKIYNRRYLLDNELNFIEGIIHEDELFSIKSLFYAKNVRIIQSAIYRRRIRENSIMTKEVTLKNAEGYFVTFIEVLRFFESQFISFPLNDVFGDLLASIKRNFIKVFLKFTENNQYKLFNTLTSVQKYYFDAFFRDEITNLKFLEEQRLQLTSKDRWIADRESVIQSKDREIEVRDSRLAEQRELLAGKDRWIADRESVIQSKDREIEARDSRLAEQRELLAGKDKKILELENLSLFGFIKYKWKKKDLK